MVQNTNNLCLLCNQKKVVILITNILSSWKKFVILDWLFCTAAKNLSTVQNSWGLRTLMLTKRIPTQSNKTHLFSTSACLPVSLLIHKISTWLFQWIQSFDCDFTLSDHRHYLVTPSLYSPISARKAPCKFNLRKGGIDLNYCTTAYLIHFCIRSPSSFLTVRKVYNYKNWNNSSLNACSKL